MLDLFERGTVPRRLILRGSSPAALDLSSLLTRLGSQVTLVSETPLAPSIDPDALRLLIDHLEKRGLTRLSALPPARPADLPLWEMGEAQPALEGLELDKAGIRLRDGHLILKKRL